MNQQRIKILGLSMLLVFIGQTVCPAASSSSVESIIDGQTLMLADGTEVRLIGVTTKGEDDSLSADFARAEYLSKKYMQAAVVGKSVILTHDRAYARSNNRDSKGRLYAYVRYSAYFQDRASAGDGTRSGASSISKNLNSEIIKQGYGFAERSGSYDERESYIRFEKEARDRQKGIWRPQAKFYDRMLERAKGSIASSSSKYVDKNTRRLSMETARKTLNELIQLVPNDYRAFFERSWIGVDSYNDKLSKSNLEDIDQAIELSPNNPKCFVQKHFLLRLEGRHGEAVIAYDRAVELASKYGLTATVSYFTEQELLSGKIQDPPGDSETVGFAADIFRATLNEDHFLIFMARYHSLADSRTSEMEALYSQMMENQIFKAFYEQHKELVENKSPREILYQTKWAVSGWDQPEEAFTAMERAVL